MAALADGVFWRCDIAGCGYVVRSSDKFPVQSKSKHLKRHRAVIQERLAAGMAPIRWECDVDGCNFCLTSDDHNIPQKKYGHKQKHIKEQADELIEAQLSADQRADTQVQADVPPDAEVWWSCECTYTIMSYSPRRSKRKWDHIRRCPEDLIANARKRLKLMESMSPDGEYLNHKDWLGLFRAKRKRDKASAAAGSGSQARSSQASGSQDLSTHGSAIGKGDAKDKKGCREATTRKVPSVTWCDEEAACKVYIKAKASNLCSVIGMRKKEGKEDKLMWAHPLDYAVSHLAVSRGLVAVASGDELHIIDFDAGDLHCVPFALSGVPILMEFDEAGCLILLFGDGQLQALDIIAVNYPDPVSLNRVCEVAAVECMRVRPNRNLGLVASLIGVEENEIRQPEPMVRLFDGRVLLYDSISKNWIEFESDPVVIDDTSVENAMPISICQEVDECESELIFEALTGAQESKVRVIVRNFAQLCIAFHGHARLVHRCLVLVRSDDAPLDAPLIWFRFALELRERGLCRREFVFDNVLPLVRDVHALKTAIENLISV